MNMISYTPIIDVVFILLCIAKYNQFKLEARNG